MLALDDKWIWDSWYFDTGDAFHVFFLQAPRSLGDPHRRHANASVGHAVSSDLRTWALLPDALAAGARGAFDEIATWTGCVVADGAGWLMFYTGLAGDSVQRIGLAESNDLVTWTKHPSNPLLESDPQWYEPPAGNGRWQPAWRDPWVYTDGGEHHMLITARVNVGPSPTRGVVARASSDDLRRWRTGPPLTGPSDFAEMEVPQLIDVEGRRVLIFSCGAEGLSPERRREPAAGGSYALVIDGDPTPSADALALDLPGWYACRVVADRTGEAHVIGFINHDATGAFVGLLPDPVPLRVAAPALFR